MVPEPDLSVTCVTFEPDTVTVLESCASIHNLSPVIDLGEKGREVHITEFNTSDMTSFLYSLRGSGLRDLYHHQSLLQSMRGGVGDRFRPNQMVGYPTNPAVDKEFRSTRVYLGHGQIRSGTQDVTIPDDLNVVFLFDPAHAVNIHQMIPTGTGAAFRSFMALMQRPDYYDRWVLRAGQTYTIANLYLIFREEEVKPEFNDWERRNFGVLSWERDGFGWRRTSLQKYFPRPIPFNTFLRHEYATIAHRPYQNGYEAHPTRARDKVMRTWYIVCCSSEDDPDVVIQSNDLDNTNNLNLDRDQIEVLRD